MIFGFAVNNVFAAACGSANGASYYTVPTTNLCSSGTASSVSGSGPWTWTCYAWIPISVATTTLQDADISSTGQYQLLSGGWIYMSSNYGATWTKSSISGNLTSVSNSSSGQYITVTEFYNGTVYTSSDYGATWTNRGSLGVGLGSVELSSTGQYQVIASSSTGPIYTSSDYGATWTARGSFSNMALNHGAAISSTGQYMTVVENVGQIYTSSDYGATWTARGSSNTWNAVGMSSTGQYQTAGSSDYIYTSSDYGATWTQRIICPGCPSGSIYWNGIGMSDSGQRQVAIIKSGQIYTSSDYGATWTASGSTSSWYAVGMSGTGQYVVIGSIIKEIYTSSDYGTGSNASCSANLITNGICGSSNGGSFPSAPTTNLCSAGTASAVSGSGPWTWTCNGINGGTTASCSASLSSVSGSCGTANGHGYSSTSYIDTSAERCAAGTFTSFTDAGSSWTWSCTGSGGGTTASCSANKVSCGTYHNTVRRDQPSTNLCAYGTNTTLSLSSNIWYWSCTNNPGVTLLVILTKQLVVHQMEVLFHLLHQLIFVHMEQRLL